jgi:CXXC-20-CXXC protein
METYKITKCKKCGKTLSSKAIFKSYWKGYKKFDCLNCHNEYEFNSKDRLIGGFVIGISIFITGLIIHFLELENVWKLIFGVSSLAIFSVALSALSIPLLRFENQNNE